jgi:choline kinase
MSDLYNSKAVILAAGVSKRLRPLTDEIPKCLLEVGGRPILQWTIENILQAGIKEIAIVVGYRKEMIREFVKQNYPRLRIRFIYNPNYLTTNNAYSLILAKRFLENADGQINSGLLLLDSDILFSSDILPLLISDNAADKIVLRASGAHNEEEIRVKVDDDGNILIIGKEIPLEEAYGESIGIELFSTETAAKLFTILDHRIRSGIGRTEFYEASFQEMINLGIKLKAIDIGNCPAIEIDTIEDLQQARQIKVV